MTALNGTVGSVVGLVYWRCSFGRTIVTVNGLKVVRSVTLGCDMSLLLLLL